jgi:FkbM family methyltransferase
MKRKIHTFIYKMILKSGLDQFLGFLGRYGLALYIVKRLAPPCTMYNVHVHRSVKIKNISFVVQMSDLMSWPIYFGLDMDELNILKKIIPTKSVIVDVGANVGRWALFSQAEKIYAFEPFPKTFNNLKNNLELNPSLKIQPLNLALSNQKASVSMQTETITNSGMNKISTAHSPLAVQVQTTTLDSWVSENDIQKIDFIKIDVEGYEMQVLAGADYVISKFKPSLFLEIDDQLLKKYATTPVEIFNFLKQKNYEIKILPGLESIDSRPSYENIHIDVLAVQTKEQY